MANFQIPESDIKKIEKLAKLIEEHTEEKLLKCLSEAPIGCWGSDLAQLIKKNIGIEFKAAKDIVELLFTITSNRRFFEKGIDSFIEDLLFVVKESNPELANDTKLESFIKKILLSKNIQITTKAIELEGDREKLLSNTRIITDIRPIFDDENSDSIEKNIILHNLRIRYMDADGNHEIYFAVDRRDLQNLKEQIIRAEHKENRIKKGIGNIEIIDI